MDRRSPAEGRSGASLRLDRVSKRFSRDGHGAVAAVRDVSLTVAPGELVTLLGPSGCGKTTTLRIVAGFEAPDEGRVHVGGEDVTDVLVHRRSIGFVFQSYALFPHLTVFENVAYALRVKRLAETAIRERVGRVLDLVGLPTHEGRFPSQLSGGEQQRVAVARAVVGEPQLLLFDEPLSNLDAKLRVQMRAELSRLQRQLAITTIYVTHDQEEAMAISDRIAVMRAGRIEQVGTARELYAAPASAFVAQFIGRVNLVGARAVGGAEVELWGRRAALPDGALCPAGAAVSLVLRPESIALLPPEAREPTGHPAVDGVVRARLFLGEKAEYTVEAAGETLQAVVYDPLHRGLFEVGARVRVACDPASLRPLAPSAGDDLGGP